MMRPLYSLLILSFALWTGQTAAQSGNFRTYLCHNGNTIVVSNNAAQAHLNHGDTPGLCNPAEGCIDPSQIIENPICIQVADPVCGCDGNTYANSCYAAANGVTVYERGFCGCIDPTKLIVEDPIFCALILAPVCGCNGVTYSNSCLAEASGVTQYTDGACGSPPILVPLKKDQSDISDQGIMLGEATTEIRPEVFPNPFSGTAAIRFGFPQDENVQVAVFDVTGALVQILFDGAVEKNREYQVQFDASRLEAGVYFYTVTTTGETYMDKMLLVK